MTIFITYSDAKYAETRAFCAMMARLVGRFDKVIEYSPDDVDDTFKASHAETFACKRGAGLWIWKPYVILKALREEAGEGDVVFYCDSGTFFIRSFSHLLRTMCQDVWVSNLPLAEKQYTKRETFVRMGCEGPSYEDTPQVQAGFVGVRKTAQSMAFVEEWLSLACDHRLLSPVTDSSFPEASCYVVHREDQSILSLLCKKRGIRPHLDPTQYGLFPEKYMGERDIRIANPHDREYPAVIVLHRQPRVRLRHSLFQYLHVLLPRRVVRMFLSKEYYVTSDKTPKG